MLFTGLQHAANDTHNINHLIIIANILHHFFFLNFRPHVSRHLSILVTTMNVTIIVLPII